MGGNPTSREHFIAIGPKDLKEQKGRIPYKDWQTFFRAMG
jgi:hypothetical protein